jgi:hypothetical protein
VVLPGQGRSMIGRGPKQTGNYVTWTGLENNVVTMKDEGCKSIVTEI